MNQPIQLKPSVVRQRERLTKGKILPGRTALLIGLAFAALTVTGALAQSPTSVSIELITTFDYPGTVISTQPQSISDLGDTVGGYVDSGGVTRGFIRLSNGTFSNPLVDPADTGNFTYGRGINNSRVACGDYSDASGNSHGFFFFHSFYQNFDVAGSTSTAVLGINNARDFAGSVIPTGGIQQAFLSIGGTVTEFVVPDATATLAYSLNTTDQSCGYYVDSSGVTLHGFWRDSDGTIHAPIDPVGSISTILFGNNDGNQMVGRYIDATGATHGILFVPPNRFVVYDFPGATFTSLNGINKHGQIAGRYTDPSSGIDHGILLQVVRSSAGVTLPLAPSSAPTQAVPQRAVVTAPAY
jgi:hypothetical protein